MSSPLTPLLGRPASRPHILELPHELLTRIIQLSQPSVESDVREQHGAALSLIRACRRFRQIATIYLYDELDVQFGQSNVVDSKKQEATKLLHRTLEENPPLRPLCRTLWLALHHMNPDHVAAQIDMALDFVLWLNGVRRLSISGSPADFRDDWPILPTAIASMPHLNELSVQNQLWGVVRLHKLLDTLPCPPTLKLSGRFLDTVAFDTFDFAEKEGTALFNSLVVYDWDETPQDLSLLLKWPARLEQFSYLFQREMGWGALWSANLLLFGWSLDTPSLSSICRALEPHRTSLRSLTIGPPGKYDLEEFELTRFDKLEELSLARTATGGDDEAHRVAKFLAPNLETFRWTFAESCAVTTLSDWFYSRRWLRAFIQAARSGGCPLRLIEIEYSPLAVFGDRKRREPQTFEYPWDELARIRSELQPAGIHLLYDPPSITRHQFNAVFDQWFVTPPLV